MDFSKEFVKKMLETQYLHRCGEVDVFAFEVEYLNDKKQIEKSITSAKWEVSDLLDGDV
ncbi:MAG: hypothetical protein IJA07_10435 [Agathobacter sp.]|nr:hypothetical protein [Agathobacter sp.]